MKVWKKFREFLKLGEWHIHTSYTDGKNTVFEICEVASRLNIPLIAFTEHVRKNISYDFNQFLIDIERAREEYPEIIILSGVEAKVLPTGLLDVESWILKEVDYPIFAFHSFPSDLNLYIESLKRVVKNYSEINSWAHPGLFLIRNNLRVSRTMLLDILSHLKSHDVVLEINKKYSLPPREWLDLASAVGLETVNGNDIHSITELLKYYKTCIF